ncbi:enterobactin synthetase component D [Arthrobacter sp. 2762]
MSNPAISPGLVDQRRGQNSALFEGSPCVGAWIVGRRLGEQTGTPTAQKKRADQHFLGRLAAANALFCLGGAELADVRVGVDADGCPDWPLNIAGSISHSGSVAVSAVAPTDRVLGVGVDVEQIRSRSKEMAARVRLPGDALKAPAGLDEHLLTTLFFSVRESVFKCVFPTLRQAMDWPDCHVELDWDLSRFTATAVTDGPIARLKGRFLIDDGMVGSLCWWPIPDGPTSP